MSRSTIGITFDNVIPMTYTTTMTSKGQITVPAPIRKKLGLQPGESINIELKGNTAVVTANDWQKGLAEIQAEIAAHLKAHNVKPASIAELSKLREQAGQEAAWERYSRSLQD